MMFVLDTDTLSHLLRGHPRVVKRRAEVTAEVTLAIITRIEILQGRFASVLKAEDREKLLAAQRRLAETEKDLAKFMILPVDARAADEFEKLRQNRSLKSIGRGDLLMAAIALASKATLVTRNTKDFRKVPGLRIENWVD